MTRREMLALASVGALRAQPTPDYKLTIDRVSLEIAPKVTIKTIGYNGTAPGPLLRMKEGQRVTIEVSNNTDEPEIVHWHGLKIPSEVDGSAEEGTPLIPPHRTARYSFTATPAGTRWYHTHVPAMRNLKRGAYTGQFGFLYVEDQAGGFDQEVFLALRDWDPYMTTAGDSMDVAYKYCTINSHALGFGEPLRVKEGQRVMMRILNASATLHKRIAFASHSFKVVAMDGNPVGNPRTVPVLELGPGERVDAVVEMNQPGVWILGSVEDKDRKAGLGIVVEYAGKTNPAQWLTPSKEKWDYTVFGSAGNGPAPEKIPLLIEKKFAGSRWVDKWTINGKSWPKTDPIRVKRSQRYRLVFDNRSDEAHPVHLHRHTFELKSVAATPISGVFKDVVVVPQKSVVEADFVADNPGKTLFHCHQQMHMDYGFMSLLEYDVP